MKSPFPKTFSWVCSLLAQREHYIHSLCLLFFLSFFISCEQVSAQGVTYSQAFVGTAVKTQVVTISNVVTGQPVNLRITNDALLNNPNTGDPGYVQVSHSVTAGETPAQVASDLRSKINGNARLSSIGITATDNTSGSITLTSNSTKYTLFTSPETTGATVTFLAYSQPSAGTFRVGAAGSGISGSADSIGYVYSSASGNTELISKVTWNVSPSTSYGIAGLVFRESLDANAQEASITVSQGNGVNFTVRSQTGGTIKTTLGPALTAPIYLRLVRSGSSIAGYQSSDRINWQLVGTYTFASFPSSYLSGFAVSSTNASMAVADFTERSYLVSVPQRTSSMLLWLRSDAGVSTTGGAGTDVTSWADQSGNAMNASNTTNRPTLALSEVNGLPAIKFTRASNQFLKLGTGFANLSGGYSAFVVAKVVSNPGTSHFVSLGSGADANSVNFLPLSTTNTLFDIWSGASETSITGSGALTLGQYQLQEAIHNGAAVATVYTNGVQKGTGSVNNIQNTTRTSNNIGNFTTSATNRCLDGYIAEIILYKSGLTTTERQSIEAYIYSKYGVGTAQTLAAPQITPSGAVVTSPTKVTITADPNATVYYTLDGSLPVPGNSNTFRYSDSFVVSQTTTVNAIAVAPYYRTGSSSSIIQFAPTTNGIPKTGMLLWLRSDTGVILNSTQTATVTAPLTTGQPVTIRINNAALNSAGYIDKTYTVLAGDSTSTIATALSSAINGDSTLNANGISATASTNVVTVSSTSPFYTTYSAPGSTGATVTISSNVKQWSDISGAGHNATNTSNFPTFASSAINGLPALSFASASSQYLQLPSTGFEDLTKGLTYVAVVKPTTITGCVVSLGNGASANAVQLVLTNSTWVGLDLFTGTTETSVYSTSGATAGSTQIFETIHNGAGNATVLTNGVQGNQGSIGNLLNATRGFNYIGRYSGGTNYLNGQVAELIVYDHPLTPGERIALESYLSNRYFNSLVISPPTGVYGGTQTVTLAAGSGDTIWYTLDGSTPIASAPSIQYTGPFSVTQSTVVKAIKASAPSTILTSFIAIDPDSAVVPRNGLSLWLRPGFGQFSPGSSNWVDLSGNGGDATLQPTVCIQQNSLNGYSMATNECAIVPPGFFGYLTLPSGMNSFNGTSVFAVGKPVNYGANNGGVWLDLGNGSASNNIRLENNGTGGTSASFSIYNGAASSSISAASSVNIGNYQILAGTQNGSTSGSLYVNGVLKTTGTLNKPNSLARTGSRLMATAASSGAGYNGGLVEVLVYNRALTSAEIAATHSYLLNKYQLLNAAPTAPIISLPTSSLAAPSQVTISAPPDCTVYFTTDGSTPSTSSQVYSNPLWIYYTQTVKAIAVKNTLTSSVSSATYTLDSSTWPAPNPSDPPLNITPQLPTTLQP